MDTGSQCCAGGSNDTISITCELSMLSLQAVILKSPGTMVHKETYGSCLKVHNYILQSNSQIQWIVTGYWTG